ncbi:disulfide oxidoreductase [Gracilibacillus saliphilus]|uniref:disulfide oxidoreductase n=1 Tax=Gracilibacillus saliphilus TaxID=543890 RepID=UPI0013D4B43D|nr:disulfide oxidoreductase [Gracilibacillus saliphilus]
MKQYFIYIAWMVSVIATIGSLFFSEILHFTPCKLCWFSRILMYPLSIILGIAAYYNDYRVKIYVLPFSLLGIGLSIFHYFDQKTTFFRSLSHCSESVPCNGMYINWLGFITIPFLALCAFLLISLFLLMAKEKVR